MSVYDQINLYDKPRKLISFQTVYRFLLLQVLWSVALRSTGKKLEEIYSLIKLILIVDFKISYRYPRCQPSVFDMRNSWNLNHVYFFLIWNGFWNFMPDIFLGLIKSFFFNSFFSFLFVWVIWLTRFKFSCLLNLL